jgi:hypothetical protein
MNELEATVFVYYCRTCKTWWTAYFSGEHSACPRCKEDQSFEHVATINPRLWIEALQNGEASLFVQHEVIEAALADAGEGE